MATIDWTSPQIIGSSIAGAMALIGVVAVALINRKKGGKDKPANSQQTILSRDVSQVQVHGDMTVMSPAEHEKPKRKR